MRLRFVFTSLFLLILLVYSGIYSQECKVLVRALADEYKGECKKGLAHGEGKAKGVSYYEGDFRKGYPHGEGIYKYENGDIYIGELKKGMKHGEGELHTKINSKDTLFKGLWEKDKYLGVKLIRPEVLYRIGIDSYSFRRVRDGNRVLIDVLINGTPNIDLEDLTLISTSGEQFSLGRSIGFENVTFPVVCKIRYQTWNKIGSARHWADFEFKITQPGDWKVIIIN